MYLHKALTSNLQYNSKCESSGFLERLENHKLDNNEWNECLAAGQPSSASHIEERERERELNRNDCKPEFSQENDIK